MGPLAPPSCQAYVAIMDTYPFQRALGEGRGWWQMLLPMNSALIGVEFTAQAAVEDSRKPFGWYVTNGLLGIVGS